MGFSGPYLVKLPKCHGRERNPDTGNKKSKKEPLCFTAAARPLKPINSITQSSSFNHYCIFSISISWILFFCIFLCMAESRERVRNTLVVRKPCYGLPTGCPQCLSAYIYLKLAQVPFAVDFHLNYPDSGIAYSSSLSCSIRLVFCSHHLYQSSGVSIW